MTGYESKRAAARNKLLDDDDIQIYKRPWVGLTDEDILKWRSKYKFSRELLKEVESLLKEKNT